MIKSHKYLPKGHMKPFSLIIDNKNFTYVLNAKSNKIQLENIKYVNVELGFFTDEVEENLNKHVESKFFSLRDLIIKYSKDNVLKNFALTIKQSATVLNYLEFSMMRNKKNLESVNRESFSSLIFDGYTNNSLVDLRLEQVITNNFFSNTMPLVVENFTSSNFILPSTTFAPFFNNLNNFKNSNILYVIPISPKIAYLLVNKKDYDDFFAENNSSYCMFENDNVIKQINKFAFMSCKEIEDISELFFVSINIEDLECLLQ